MIRLYRSLRPRLIGFLIVAIVLTSGPAVYFFYDVSQRNMEEKSSDFIVTSMHHITEQFNSLITNIYKNMLVFTTNEQLWFFLRENDYLNDGSRSEVLWIRDQLSGFRTLNQSIFSVFLLDFNKQFAISSAEGAVTASENARLAEYIDFMYDPENNVLDNRLIVVKDDGRYYKQFAGLRGEPDTYAIIVPIRDMVFGPPLGIMVINVAESAVRNIFQDTQFTDDAHIYLAHAHGAIVSGKDRSEEGLLLPEPFLLGEGEVSRIVRHNEQEYLVTNTRTAYNDWVFVSATPFRKLIDTNQDALKLILTYVIVALIGISALMIVLIERFFYKPIYRLLREIRLRNNGRESGGADRASRFEQRQDEIGFIFRSFNDILEEKERLLGNMYAQELLVKDTKLRSLYTQINPHFLYNTLDNIRWLAMGMTGGDNKVSDTIQSLSAILKHSVHVDRQFVTVEEELRLARMYVQIQQTRYGERIEVEWNVAEETAAMPVMTFVLQPLLENAITHGIESSERPGRIVVTIRKEDGGLRMVVRDNGVGLGEERLQYVRNLIAGVESTDSKGIGLRNIYERIRWFYGDGATLLIDGRERGGATVTVFLPAPGGGRHV